MPTEEAENGAGCGTMGRMRLLLIRHGQTSSNVGQHLDTAEPGADLTPLGRKQAAAIPVALEGEPVDLIVASNLVRTQQTAAPLAEARGLTPLIRPGVREIGAGDYEMLNDAQSIQSYLGAIFGWGIDLEGRMPGAESGTEVLARYDEVVGEAAGIVGDGTAVIFSHGAVIRAWAAARADGIDFEYAKTHWLPNTGLVALTGEPGSWQVTEWGDCALGERVTAQHITTQR